MWRVASTTDGVGTQPERAQRLCMGAAVDASHICSRGVQATVLLCRGRWRVFDRRLGNMSWLCRRLGATELSTGSLRQGRQRGDCDVNGEVGRRREHLSGGLCGLGFRPLRDGRCCAVSGCVAMHRRLSFFLLARVAFVYCLFPHRQQCICRSILFTSFVYTVQLSLLARRTHPTPQNTPFSPVTSLVNTLFPYTLNPTQHHDTRSQPPSCFDFQFIYKDAKVVTAIASLSHLHTLQSSRSQHQRLPHLLQH